MRTLLQASMQTTQMVEKPADVPEESTLLAAPTPSSPQVLPRETDAQRRANALAALSDDPAIQGFYERVIPRNITPSAWMPFWPSAWSSLRD